MRERLASGRRAFSQLSRRWPASGDATWKITLWCVVRGLRFQHGSVVARGGSDRGPHPAPVEELQPAPAAVKQAASAGDTLQEVQKPAMLPVDLVGLFEPHYAVRATLRATAGGTQMVAVAARDELLAFALTAFVNCHVAETLKKSPVNPLQPFTALPALHSTSCYTQFAKAAQAARQ